ncbi:MAG: ATP-grasp domain-containing protein, partial [Methylococcales bacterium]|nr:ATP-grasp domain-containing protein [Methylococcales bacterium]
MLAQAAHNAGFKPLVLDVFSDLDTQQYAADFKLLPALTIEHLTPALDYFVQHYGVTQVVYGSGFEQHPDALRYLASRCTLLGNSPETFDLLHDKPRFFATLKQLNIPYSETVFVPPDNADNWLIKPLRGQGGVGIQRLTNTNLGLDSKVYWQKYQAGTQHSVLFLADGQHLQIIGFNTQWTAQPSNHSFPRAAWECSNGAPRHAETNEFIFAGIINYCPLADSHKAQITNWLTKLVPAFALTGLNSLDFIHTNGNSTVLEINPRPPASMQLYDADLLRRHIRTASPSKDWQSCLHSPIQTGYTGYQIIYAEQDTRIPDGTIWENGVMDTPAAGAICHTGQPIC